MTINHIGVSGGKDSTALLLWAVYESGYPLETIRATFCDTGNEHDLTYEHVRMLSQTVHPIEWLKPELGFYELALKKGRFPSRRARFCTQHLKMIPTQKHVHELVGQGYEVILHSGVRADESPERAVLEEEDWDAYMALKVRRPLLRWELKDVLGIHERYSVPLNPLYAMGCSRVGCFPCIHSNKKEIRLISKRFPERIAMLRQIEQQFDNLNGMSTFFARNTVPLAQRSKEITTVSGERMKVATIDDVVRWSRTVRGGLQYELDFDDYGSEDRGTACPSSLGMCE